MWDLSWLLFTQNLKSLHVGFSPEIEEIINKEKGSSITKEISFGNLESLIIYKLPELTEICWNFRTLPNSRNFDVKDCPKLLEDIANFPRHAEE